MKTPITPTVTEELISGLEAAANAATPGPWNYDGSYVCTMRQEDDTVYVESWNPIADALLTKNVHYIAKSNPATILALLQHVRELKADAERYRFLRDPTTNPGFLCRREEYRKYFTEFTVCDVALDASIDAARSSAD